MDTLELFLSLEALHLITREDTPLPGTAGPGPATFSLKKGFIRFILAELEKRERFRPVAESRPRRFLKLLHLSRSQVGWQGVKATYTQETLAHHPDGTARDPAAPAGGRPNSIPPESFV
jgi:hypothetical protein